jgi:predicted nucleic acid-binding protein
MKATRWLVDTDVLIDYLRGHAKAIAFLEKTIIASECYISTITIAELYVGVREGKEKQVLDLFIQQFRVAELDQMIAQAGGLYKRDYGKSHGVGLADAIIAATSAILNLKLVTLNRKHFPMLSKVHVPYRNA